MTLSTFASMNNTDIDTLLRLNPEAIEVNNKDPENTTYYVLSDSLTVPDFISKSEYKEIADYSYEELIKKILGL